MPEVDRYEPGTPSWVDIGFADVEKGTQFYSDLFGWDVVEPDGDPEDRGGYMMFKQGGRSIAGAGPLQMEGQPSVWLTYVTVDSADETAQKVAEGGGNTLLEPMDVMDAGRMGIFMDPAGAAFAIWEPGEHIGAQLVNEPVSLTWNELITTDVPGSERFYGKVFGWTFKDAEMMEGYRTIHIGEREIPVGGLMAKNEGMPAEMPPVWWTYFNVADADATAAKAKELGAQLMMEPMDAPPGRLCAIVDPGGAAFSILTPAEGQ